MIDGKQGREIGVLQKDCVVQACCDLFWKISGHSLESVGEAGDCSGASD